VVEIFVRAVETSDFERRLRELEEAHAARRWLPIAPTRPVAIGVLNPMNCCRLDQISTKFPLSLRGAHRATKQSHAGESRWGRDCFAALAM